MHFFTLTICMKQMYLKILLKIKGRKGNFNVTERKHPVVASSTFVAYFVHNRSGHFRFVIYFMLFFWMLSIITGRQEAVRYLL